jgi:predicted HTH transcriptional regulator
MTLARDPAYLVGLVRELCALPKETAWVEFKVNNDDPDRIGELISALSNAAALEGRESAYLVWGVDDTTHAVVGTRFCPAEAKRGAQELESWLVQMTTPRLHIRFHEVEIDGRTVVVLEIPKASGQPTVFAGKELVRVGSIRKPLKDTPEHERALWRSFDATPFEERPAATDLDAADALALLDYTAYFRLLGLPVATDQAGILARLQEDRMLRRNDAGRWTITNLGAVLFALDLARFPSLGRKALRLVVYDGRGKLLTNREHLFAQGYATGFAAMIDFLTVLLPRNEVIGTALRRDAPMYPDLAVRELIANALIHQDFAISGAGPMVEVFSDRLEISNPGTSLVDVARLVDCPPRSRNEALASFMRRIGVCEERGSGADKVVFETEVYQLPPPVWEPLDGSMRVTLFAHRGFAEMGRVERVHACYLHACLRFVMREPMTNTTVRQRFGIDAKNAATASRIIKDALDAGLVKPYDEDQSKRHSRYLPFWA